MTTKKKPSNVIKEILADPKAKEAIAEKVLEKVVQAMEEILDYPDKVGDLLLHSEFSYNGKTYRKEAVLIDSNKTVGIALEVRGSECFLDFATRVVLDRDTPVKKIVK